jgi:hypothetical protein
MAVTVTIVDGSESVFHDDEAEFHSYAVNEAGVLRVLKKQQKKDWFVRYEYSPAGWLGVTGTRYLGTKIARMDGEDGSTTGT